jgi:hypothetical protein
MHRGAARSERVLFHVVEMCCLSETLTGVYFTEMLARATSTATRGALESLLEDEIDHGRAGWAYLATRSREKTLDGLDHALPEMMDRTVGRALRTLGDEAEEDDPTMEAFGYLGGATAKSVLKRALHDVILPGFSTLGVALDPVRAHIAKQGWGS